MDYLAKHNENKKRGIESSWYSCCTANEDVIRAAILRARATNSPVLIEATSNQVNQFGGYTNMRPAGYAEAVKRIAKESNLSEDLLYLGGDHLGPLIWTDKPEEQAMELAKDLVQEFVEAGFQKIHLDTSMRLADDDPSLPLEASVCARRGAILCEACEKAFKKLRDKNKNAKPPIYVIGSEVPVPGGEADNNPSGLVTSPKGMSETLDSYKEEFEKRGLSDAFARISGLVVDFGVEFAEGKISDFNEGAFSEIKSAAKQLPFGLEAHSTDYQTKEHLKEMAESGAVYLKVGPSLTNACRSGLFKLQQIEKLLIPEDKLSFFSEELESSMINDNVYWKNYYKNEANENKIARAFSYSDRCRYYFATEGVSKARAKLLNNLKTVEIPEYLWLEFFEMQYWRIRNHELNASGEAVLLDYIGDRIDDYLFATNMNKC